MSDQHPARARRFEDPARRLRSDAWLLQRSWRQPQRLPAGWRSERFARSVDRTRRQLEPIMSLAALADSYGREALHQRAAGRPRRTAATPAPRRSSDAAVEMAYATRWLELHWGAQLRAWGSLCEQHSR